MTEECQICAKHRGLGTLRGELVARGPATTLTSERARLTGRTRNLSSVAILASVLALTACTPSGFTEHTGPQETTISGRFGGEARGDAGCAWIETSSRGRVEVTYPNGWRLEFDPVALFDETGRQRARSGETLTIKGYFEDVGASVCQSQPAFAAIDVRTGP